MADEKIRYVLEVDDKGTTKLVKFGQTAAVAGDKASKGFNKAGKAVGDFGAQLPGVGSGLSFFAGGPAVAAGAAVAALGVGFASIVSKSIDMADNMNDLSLRLGVSTERLSVLSLYAEQSGTDIDTLASAMGKLGVKLSDGDKQLQSYGITATSVDEALFQLSDKIAGTTDPMLRLKMATDAFGKSGQQMLPLLVQGGDALRSMASEAPIVSTEMAKMADEFNDKMAGIKGRLIGVGLGIAENVLPFLDKWAEGLGRIADMLGLVSDAQKAEQDRTEARSKIVTTFGEAMEKDKKTRDQLGLGDRTQGVRIDGMTLQEALAAFDRNNKRPTAPLASGPTGVIGAGKTVGAAKPDKPNQVDFFEVQGIDATNVQFRANQARQTQFDAAKTASGDTGNGASNEADFLGQYPDYYAGLPMTDKARESLEKQYDAEQEIVLEKAKETSERQAAIAAKASEVLVASGMAGFQVFDDMFARMQSRNAEMEDSWTKTFQGIGLAFSSMLVKMIEEMAVKAAIFGAFSLFGGGAALGAGETGGSGLLNFLGFASGGAPPVGMPVEVGERRRELFIPQGPGRVAPTTGAGSSITINVTNPAEARSMLRAVRTDERKRNTGIR